MGFRDIHIAAMIGKIILEEIYDISYEDITEHQKEIDEQQECELIEQKRSIVK